MPEGLVRLEDRVGLVAADMLEPRPVGSAAEVASVLAEPGTAPFSVAGFRASQGGHTLVPQGRMLTTEILTRPLEVDPGDYDPLQPRREGARPPQVRVGSGALWSQVHHALHPYGLAPLVHQSSCHFSVGGSISVNCHGRDPRQGPLSSVLRSVDVQLADGSQRSASREQEPELFRAVAGGYGSCGMVTAAQMRVGPNLVLEQRGRVMGSLSAYAGHLADIIARREGTDRIHLHYGWLRCTDALTLYDDVLGVDYLDAGLPHAVTGGELRVETWGETELMRAGWAAARRRTSGVRRDLWSLAVDQLRQPQQACRLDWMRAAIGFTSYRGSEDQDILQEYFVPLAQFERMVAALRRIYTAAAANVLSTTVRIVRAEDAAGRTHLAYAPDAERVCIAVDLNIPVDPQTRVPPDAVRAWLRLCVDAALDCGGTYYLPYYPVATLQQFRAGFPDHPLQRAALERYNPRRRLHNLFLRQYVDQS